MNGNVFLSFSNQETVVNSWTFFGISEYVNFLVSCCVTKMNKKRNRDESKDSLA